MTTEHLLALGRRVALEQDTHCAAEPATEIRKRVLVAVAQRPALQRVARRRRAGYALVGAAMALFAAWFAWAPGELSASLAGRPASEGAWFAAQRSTPLELSDGSRFVFAPGTRGRLAELTSGGAHLVVEAGSVDAAVVHRSRTKYRMSFGPFAVEVTGTRFDVHWDPASELLTLDLREGSVLVSGCVLGSGRPLLAGERLRAWCRDKRFEVQASALPSPDAEPSAVGPLPKVEGAATPPATARAEPPSGNARPAPAGQATTAPPAQSWQELARGGAYGDAFARIGAANFGAECERVSAADLALLADVARLSKNTAAAIQAYSVLRRRYPAGSKSAQAAFGIARLHFDQLAQYDEAARWFRTYLREQPGGALAREALGRLMESEQRAGQRELARGTAREYLRRYPDGPHARLAGRLGALP